jgi:hypothetical protein
MLTLGNERCAMALHACITFLDAVLSCRDDLPHCSVSPADTVPPQTTACHSHSLLGIDIFAMALYAYACIAFFTAVFRCRDDLPHCSVSPADAVAQEDRDCKHPGVISTALTL